MYPALAIADELRRIRDDACIRFIGAKGKLEARAVPEHGYEFRGIWISGFHRRLKPANLLFPLKLAVSLVQSFFLIRSFRPDVVIGTGGYASGPVLWMASKLRIPVVIHESNSYPGVTTRLVAKHAAIIFTAFPETAQWIGPRDRIRCVGTPLRRSLGSVEQQEGRRFFGLQEHGAVVLVIGGSQGAVPINRAVLKEAERFSKERIQLIWQIGAMSPEDLDRQREAPSIGWMGGFIDKMEYAYAAADVVLCRAGASTIAEITALGKAAVLVPLPHAAAGHQLKNARTLQDHGAAVVVEEQDLDTRLFDEVRDLVRDSGRRTRMEAASRTLGRPDAGAVVAQHILELL